MKKHEHIAVLNDTAFSGIYIVDTDGDYITFQYGHDSINGMVWYPLQTREMEYIKAYSDGYETSPYFMYRGYRYYLDDFMRV